MSLPELPRLDASQFRWHPAPGSSRTLQRLANGTEAWVGIKDENAKGQYDTYLNTSLRVQESGALSLSTLRDALVLALVQVRFAHPDIACGAVWGQDASPSKPHLQYTPPESTEAALAWARSRVAITAGDYDGLQLQLDLSRQRRSRAPRSAPSFSITLLSNESDRERRLLAGAKVDMLIRFNHIFWDAMSSRDFTGQILRCAAKHLQKNAAQTLPSLEWGTEIARLATPLLDACAVDVDTLGADFEAARGEFVDALLRSGASWGLPVTNSTGDARSEWFTFSKEQTKKMIQAVKTRLGQQYTISHLGHAAMVLALLQSNPLGSSAPPGTALITPLPVNGRRFLKREHQEHRFGSCQAGAVVEFKDLASWAPATDHPGSVQEALGKLSRHVKDSYDYWLRNQFQLPLGISKDNFLSAFLSSSPMPFTGSSIPIFVTDGLVDNYVPGHVATPDGEQLLDVESCVFGVDTYMSDILIRMESWKGATVLSVCYNDGCLQAETAREFLGRVAQFMLAFIQEEHP
ncbi:15-O-acetyltransferase-like protein [Akanthomyces lecanii RCEF 1005]|uniref:15-O-acetyltransferase-like protein n=1 Tax=Akanthomyces lecanii RCEF 1005 TaxID=1081108 RepID=A0A168BCC9_CORDF|nr:15-O-acetyltransferase-like protein [Akanthomyces lecanii RCEF 1005]